MDPIGRLTDWAPRDHGDAKVEDHQRKMFSVGWIGSKVVYFNPVVSVLSTILIWGFIIYAMVEQTDASTEIQSWQKWVTDVWNWLYMISQNVWVVVLMYCCYKYWGLKLGKDDDPVEFGDVSYFAMLFSCGVATGLWFYTAEANWHYEGYNTPRWMDRQMFNDNTRAEHAMMVTFFHWGLHGWIPYVVLGALVALLTYRRGFPLSLRFCMYPLIGEMCYGVLGDLIEVLSILCTLFGVCTSLGIGALQINKGLQRLDQDVYQGIPNELDGWGIDYETNAQVWIIAIITLCATTSVVLGLKMGIQVLANIAFALSFFILLSILFLDETWYILNACTSAFGYYLWYLPKIAFHTDAWEELGSSAEGMGGAPDNAGGLKGWMNGWTIFYWGWWISWGPFVGTFIARISKGRRLGPVIVYSLILPSLWSFGFTGIFGAAQIRITNQMITSTQECVQKLPNWSPTTIGADLGSITPESKCYNMGTCEGCTYTYASKVDKTKFGWTLPADPDNGRPSPMWKPVGDNVVKLYNLASEDALFSHISYYGGKSWSTFMTVITLICIVLYFVTSSDSASYVIDVLAANGTPNPPVAQKIFWAVSEGITAIALLVSADEENPKAALNAVKAIPIVLGLFYTFFLFWACQSLLILCKEEAGEMSITRKNFKHFLIFNVQPMSFVSFVFPFFPVGSVAAKVWGGPALVYWVAFGLTEAGFVTFLFLGFADKAFLQLAGSMYFCFALAVAALRMKARERLGITGDMVSDVVASCFWLPFVIGQMAGEEAPLSQIKDKPLTPIQEAPPTEQKVQEGVEI